MDECAVGEDNCHATLGQCSDVIGGSGSFQCSCKPGYTGDGVDSCENIDECTLGVDTCSNDTTECFDTSGSFVCVCKPGFGMGLCISKFKHILYIADTFIIDLSPVVMKILMSVVKE